MIRFSTWGEQAGNAIIALLMAALVMTGFGLAAL